jgi:hypothetical protein
VVCGTLALAQPLGWEPVQSHVTSPTPYFRHLRLLCANILDFPANVVCSENQTAQIVNLRTETETLMLSQKRQGPFRQPSKSTTRSNRQGGQ